MPKKHDQKENGKSYKPRRFFFRVIGNLGISFFTPLIGGSVAESLFDIGIDFYEALIIAAIAALFNTGLILAREAKYLGEQK